MYQLHKIYHRHRGELAKLPGVVSVGLAGKAILVTTYLPELVERMREEHRAQVRAKWALDWLSPML